MRPKNPDQTKYRHPIFMDLYAFAWYLLNYSYSFVCIKLGSFECALRYLTKQKKFKKIVLLKELIY